jgi:hypothetical protein
MKEVPESTYEDCIKKFLCAWAVGRVALRGGLKALPD